MFRWLFGASDRRHSLREHAFRLDHEIQACILDQYGQPFPPLPSRSICHTTGVLTAGAACTQYRSWEEAFRERGRVGCRPYRVKYSSMIL